MAISVMLSPSTYEQYFLKNAGAWSSNDPSVQAVERLARTPNVTNLFLSGTIHYRLMAELSSMSENDEDGQAQPNAPPGPQNDITTPAWQTVVNKTATIEAASAAKARDIADRYGSMTTSTTRARYSCVRLFTSPVSR
jgi:hypothetical protein